MASQIDGPNALPLISNAQLRAARQLLQRKHRRLNGQFLVEGAQAVREALAEPGAVRLLILTDPAQHADLVELAGAGLTVRANPGAARQLSDTVTSQGIFAVVGDLAVGLDELPTRPRLVVICAQVRDPGNAGTVIRCADAFGADAVILTQGSVDYSNPKTVRASVGSIFHLPIAVDVDFTDALAWARSCGMQVLAADAGGAELDELAASGALAQPTAWVMGNEAWGLPADVIDQVDQVVSIPMYGRAESLNLSTAAAVCLYATASTQHGSSHEVAARVRAK
ncbi:MAG: TrmH family RNA methyltransferase [Brooklawnia sp.]